MKRHAEAKWSGDLKTGAGHISTETKTLNDTPYSFSARFESGQGTNPEELLAAAHAGCFTMALSLQLQLAGFKADSLHTACTITLDKVGEGFEITHSELVLKAKVPGIERAAFETAALGAKEGCPVSKLYKTEISLTWTLED
jgi:lipoyl-dependent peroxiredoxin